MGNGATSLEDQTLVEAWTDRIVLSRNSVFGDADDVPLADWPHTGPLYPGGSYAASRTVTIPSGLQGAYQVYVQTDAGDAVYEHLDYNGNERPASRMMLVLNAGSVLVTGNGQMIANGQQEVAPENGTDFGEVFLRSPGRVHSFSLQNTGTTPLVAGGNAVSLVGGDAPALVVLSQPTATIDPGTVAGFQIAFLPQTNRNHRAVVAINCPVAPDGIFSFAVGGSGVLPRLTITNISFTAEGYPKIFWASSSTGLLYTVEVTAALDNLSTNRWFMPEQSWPIRESMWIHTNRVASTNLFYRVRVVE